jgi:hypothetical protein
MLAAVEEAEVAVNADSGRDGRDPASQAHPPFAAVWELRSQITSSLITCGPNRGATNPQLTFGPGIWICEGVLVIFIAPI